MNWWSLRLALSGWQVSTLKRPSGLAPLLAVSARNLSINLARGLHCPSRWSVQVMASAPRCIHEGRSGGGTGGRKDYQCHSRTCAAPLKAVFSSTVNLTSVTTTKWAIKISRKLFVCLLLMFGRFFFLFSFWVLKGPLLRECWWDQRGLLCHIKQGPHAAGPCSLLLLSPELVLEGWDVPWGHRGAVVPHIRAGWEGNCLRTDKQLAEVTVKPWGGQEFI